MLLTTFRGGSSGEAVMSGLRLKLLGGFDLRSASGAAIPLSARKPALLLAYLALRPSRPQGRDKLASLFWGDSGEVQARASLRQALAVLRRVLGQQEGLIVTPESETMALARGGLVTDVEELERCLASGTRGALEQAVALYEGDLLDGFQSRHPLLEEWLVTERRRVREQALAAMTTLLPETEETGPPEAGISLALRILALDPLQETAHRSLVRLYSQQGRRGAALTQHQTLRETLARELGMTPEAETHRLYREILDQRGTPGGATDLRPPVGPGAPPAASQVAGKVGTAFTQLDELRFENVERPVVAVLPFTSMSDTADQEYFADGLTDDLITALSAWRWFPVIGRHSTFAYKGKSPTIAQVANDLDVRYVVQGSVRRAGDRVRIVAQLIDAATGHHIWAQRYDRELTDIFAVQDEITERMVTAIEPELDRAERQRAARKSPDNLDAWDLAIKAQSHVYQFTADDNREAFRLLGQAIGLDPTSSFSLALLALCHHNEAILGFSDDRARSFAEAYRAAERALQLDRGNWLAHATLGIARLWTRRDFDQALAEVRRSAELNPSSSFARMFASCILEFGGRSAEAIPGLNEVVRLDPFSPLVSLAYADLALSNLLVGTLEEAVAAAEKAICINPDNVRARQRLTAALGHLGRTTEAQDALANLEKRQPGFSVEYIDSTYPFRLAEDREFFLDGLGKAGWCG
jgi:TolB-like protein/DNA-binding SARP family transcriptional activator/Flp pilus assembly protein TadD